MNLFVRTLPAAAALALASPLAAQANPGIAAALQAGTVGERYDGYLGFAAAPSSAARRQVSAINIRRRALYTQLAGRRNVNVDAVAIAAGCELLAKIRIGEAYMLNDGVWRRRATGQPPPMPSYCAR